VTALFIAGLVLKKFPLSLGAVCLAAIGSAELQVYNEFIRQLGLDTEPQVLWMLGLGFTAVALWFREDELFPLGVVSACALVLAAFTTFEPALMQRDWVPALLLIAVGVALWVRFHRLVLPAILMIPLLERLWKLVDFIGNWLFVILGFILLISGAWFSVVKGRRIKAADLKRDG